MKLTPCRKSYGRRAVRWAAVLTSLTLVSAVLADPDQAGHLAVEDAGRFHTDRANPRVLPVASEEKSFSFVVYGDRTGGPAEGVKILAEAVRETNLIEPDLVMTVGDLVQGYNPTAQWMEQMAEYRGIMDRLECPWFPVAGNHDIYWRERNSGEAKPEGEHEKSYEMHFGPLWYAFEHKNSWFIILYTDEGDAETGQKTFHTPQAQTMTQGQLDWLKATLAQARDAEHVFVFQHHPRWIGGEYGDDWERVHKVLAEAGNVSAVFAGHVHHMQYAGPRDGVEYFTLATIGGGQNGTVPRAGNLHQYNLVTVRGNRVTVATVPVGAVIDPRALTSEVIQSSVALAEARPALSDVQLNEAGAFSGTLQATMSNPAAFPAEVTLTPQSRDSNWVFSPAAESATLQPGQSVTVTFDTRRLPGPADESFDFATVATDSVLQAHGTAYPIPTTHTPVRTDVQAIRQTRPANLALSLDGHSGHLAIAPADLPLKDGPFTLEVWMKAESFGDRVGLVSKMQSSDFGIFVSRGMPSFSVHLGEAYVTAKAKQSLEAGRWYHLAGEFDGSEVRLYIDGELAGAKKGAGVRTTNNLPLLVGADVGGGGSAGSFFHGVVDDVQLTAGARYGGRSFQPARRPKATSETLLLLSFDEQIGQVFFDDSPQQLQLRPRGGAQLVDGETAGLAAER